MENEGRAACTLTPCAYFVTCTLLIQTSVGTLEWFQSFLQVKIMVRHHSQPWKSGEVVCYFHTTDKRRYAKWSTWSRPAPSAGGASVSATVKRPHLSTPTGPVPGSKQSWKAATRTRSLEMIRVNKCAWLCVRFMSLQCPGVNNNHSPPLVLLSFWFMWWNDDGITLLVFRWKATGFMLFISGNWLPFFSNTTSVPLWSWELRSTCSSEVLKSLNHD